MILGREIIYGQSGFKPQESFSLTWTPAAPAGAAPAPPYPGGACCPGAASPPLPPCEAGSGGGRWGEGWSCSRS